MHTTPMEMPGEAHMAETLVDPRFGERYTILETAEQTRGALVRIEDRAAPGPSRRPVSCHPHQEERFIVESGTLSLRVAGHEHLLGPGESFVVPPNTRHLPRNAGAGELRFITEMRPAGRFEAFLRAITAANSTGRKGVAYLLTAAQVLAQFGEVEHATPLPRPVEHLIFRGLATVGRLLAYDY
ncbi:MAG: cupin domain-containing protein [Ktedonobacterales bacterium]